MPSLYSIPAGPADGLCIVVMATAMFELSKRLLFLSNEMIVIGSLRTNNENIIH
jgi:hypothetical protein